MWRSLIWTAAFLAWAPVLAAQQEPKNPPEKSAQEKASAEAAEQFRAIMTELGKARSEIVTKYRAAEGKEQERLLKAYYALPGQFADRLVELAEKHPGDPVALQALVFVVGNVRAADEPTDADKAAAKLADKAADLLIKDHIESEELGAVCLQLQRSDSAAAEKLLRAALKDSPHKDVQGTACYALGKVLVERAGGDQKLQAEAEALFERAGKEYADVPVGRGKVGDLVEDELFMLRHLAIGKIAPEIESEDLDGEPIKLSDYRGKVVVLDFWGNW